MLHLTKETCGCCRKFLNLGQPMLECEICDKMIHAKCYKISEFKNIENLWHCSSCIEHREIRYNPCEHCYKSSQLESEAFYNEEPIDAIEIIQDMSNMLKKCRSYDKKELNELIESMLPSSSDASLFSSYFLNIDGNLANFNEFTLELQQLNTSFL